MSSNRFQKWLKKAKKRELRKEQPLLFPPPFQALSKYYWREHLHLSSAVDQKAQRGVSDDYRKILQRDFAAIPRIHIQRPDVAYLSYQQKDLLVFIEKRSCAEHR
mgnify:CR=1 FL=1